MRRERYEIPKIREAMRKIWTFALNNPHLLYVPAAGFILSLIILRIKKRYIHEGVFFRRSTVLTPEKLTPNFVEENEMSSENQIDLSVALGKIHKLAVADGDLGYAYWYKVGQLLKRADEMQAQIDSLSRELELCRARHRKTG